MEICLASPVNIPIFQSKEGSVLKDICTYFGNKTFMKHDAQGFDQFPFTNAYKIEEDSLIKTVKEVPKCKIPNDTNRKTCHILYR